MFTKTNRELLRLFFFEGKVYWYFDNTSFNQYNNIACVTTDLVAPLAKVIQKGTKSCQKMCNDCSGKRGATCTTCIACLADSAFADLAFTDLAVNQKLQGRFPKPMKEGCFGMK